MLVIIKKYLRENYDLSEFKTLKIASEINLFLVTRGIIEGDNIRHKMFSDYFAAIRIYSSNFYESLEEKSILIKNKNKLNNIFEEKLSKIEWSPVSIDLLLKYDSRINAIFGNINDFIFSDSLSDYEFFLDKSLKKNGFHCEAVKIIFDMANNKQFVFNDFIISHFDKK